MSEVFSIRLDDGLSSQIKALSNTAEWLKEAIIQKATVEFPIVDMEDYLKKYLIDKNVDFWSVHAIEIISSDNLILYDGISEFYETMEIRFPDIASELIDAFIRDTKTLKQEFEDKKIENFDKWLKTCIISSNHYNLLAKQRSGNLNSLPLEDMSDICFLYSIAQFDPGIPEEDVFKENFERRGNDFEKMKEAFIKLGLISIGYYRAVRFKHRYWHFPEISLNIMKDFYNERQNEIHRNIRESLTKQDLEILSKIVNFKQEYAYDFDNIHYYSRTVEKYQDGIIDNFDSEIRNLISRSILILRPHQGASKRKTQPDTRTYSINPMAIHAVNQRIAEFFLI